MSQKSNCALLLVAFVSLPHSLALAGWTPTAIPVQSSTTTQFGPSLVSNGNGGAHILWYDQSAPGSNLLDRQVTRNGDLHAPILGPVGPDTKAEAGDFTLHTVTKDGAGGIIATFNVLNGGAWDIRAQRIDGNGNALWGPNGVVVCAAPEDQVGMYVTPDGSGGAVCAWWDGRTVAPGVGLYVQRMDASGNMLWAADGVMLSHYGSPAGLISDGQGGAVVAWHDDRNGNMDIFVRRIDGAGNPMWAPDGVALTSSPEEESVRDMVPDGVTGGIVLGKVLRFTGMTYFSYEPITFRVDFAGNPHWPTGGISLCGAEGDQIPTALCADGNGGAIAVWEDYRTGFGADIYAARIDYDGTLPWTADGVPICTSAGNQLEPCMVSDNAGGAMIAWTDYRGGSPTADIYAARLNPVGVPMWIPNGVPVCAVPGHQARPAMGHDGESGAIVAWEDARDGTTQVFAQRIEEKYGEWGHPEAYLTVAADVPADEGGFVHVQWDGSQRDSCVDNLISHYTIEREDDGIGGTWEESGWIDANCEGVYDFTSTTTFDWPIASPDEHHFRIVAHSALDSTVTWASNVLSGHSVDNIAPVPPVSLVAQRVGTEVILTWDPSTSADVNEYAIYRSLTPGKQPGPSQFIMTVTGTNAIDTTAPNATLYYCVAARDIHGNEGGPSNEATAGTVTGAGDTPSIARLTLLDNAPNPFSATTTLRVGFPTAGRASIDVFDIAGRCVRKESVRVGAGWQNLRFDARDSRGALPSGVYFYRVSAGGESRTRKLVIAR